MKTRKFATKRDAIRDYLTKYPDLSPGKLIKKILAETGIEVSATYISQTKCTIRKKSNKGSLSLGSVEKQASDTLGRAVVPQTAGTIVPMVRALRTVVETLGTADSAVFIGAVETLPGELIQEIILLVHSVNRDCLLELVKVLA